MYVEFGEVTQNSGLSMSFLQRPQATTCPPPLVLLQGATDLSLGGAPPQLFVAIAPKKFAVRREILHVKLMLWQYQVKCVGT
jgi:hypothetical protein